LMGGGPTFSDAMHGYFRVTGASNADHRVSLDRQVFTTDDGGETWTYLFHLEMEGRWSLLRLDDQTWMANNGTERRLTIDGGRTWRTSDVEGLPDPAEYMSADFVDASNGWAASADACLSDFCTFLRAQLYQTSDGGLTWSMLGDCATNREAPTCPKLSR